MWGGRQRHTHALVATAPPTTTTTTSVQGTVQPLSPLSWSSAITKKGSTYPCTFSSHYSSTSSSSKRGGRLKGRCEAAGEGEGQRTRAQSLSGIKGCCGTLLAAHCSRHAASHCTRPCSTTTTFARLLSSPSRTCGAPPPPPPPPHTHAHTHTRAWKSGVRVRSTRSMPRVMGCTCADSSSRGNWWMSLGGANRATRGGLGATGVRAVQQGGWLEGRAQDAVLALPPPTCGSRTCAASCPSLGSG